MKIKITETLTTEARRAQFIVDGREPPASREVVLDAEQFAPEVREAMLACVQDGDPRWARSTGRSYYVRERGDGAAGAYRVSLSAPGNGELTLRPVEVQEYGRTEGVVERTRRRILAAAAYAPEACAEDEAREAAEVAERAARAARDKEAERSRCEQQAAEEEAAKAAKAAKAAAKLAWIAQHGSERLRLGMDLVGMDQVGGIYYDERLAHLAKLSGLQWERDVPESRHSAPQNPSLEALRLCQRARESAAEWGLACATPDDEPELVYVRDGGLYSDVICVLALLDGIRVLVAPGEGPEGRKG